MRNYKVSNGFTIVEMLVVISIISILMTLSLIGANTVRERSRDSKRKSDLAKAQGVLTLYYSDKKTYPLPCGANDFPCYYNGFEGGYNLMMNGDDNNPQVFKGLKGDGYTDTTIQDEKYGLAGSPTYAFRYRPSQDGLNYELSARLENENDGDSKSDNTTGTTVVDGKDDNRYERGTDKSIRTDDNTGGGATDLYPGTTPGSWTYDFDDSKTCSNCLME